ncbi:2,3-bisphosphoglycerate-dependent phosphoglycerate mutase, partial [Cellulosimicrobium cellulans]|uniref:2,3-bisphosphoglycerate-dependent phosphoglycerate mutase n=1 Tax=Cellulosimicrobium cellulans TaxID=1710 RepID=UPI003664CF51
MGSSPGTLVLVRHGQSTFNAGDRFTGLLDVPLSDVGVAEAGRAARLLADAVAREPALAPRRVTTSPLVRASTTAAIVADALPGPPPLAVEWRLVERHYGAFTDKPRDVVRRDYGEAAYWRYRRSYLHRPPPRAGPGPPPAPRRPDRAARPHRARAPPAPRAP